MKLPGPRLLASWIPPQPWLLISWVFCLLVFWIYAYMAWWWILENCLQFLIGHLSFSLSTCTSSVFPPKSCISLDFTAFTLSGLPTSLPLPCCCSSGQGLKPGECSDCPDQREAEAVMTALGDTPRSSARYEGRKTKGWLTGKHWNTER